MAAMAVGHRHRGTARTVGRRFQPGPAGSSTARAGTAVPPSLRAARPNPRWPACLSYRGQHRSCVRHRCADQSSRPPVHEWSAKRASGQAARSHVGSSISQLRTWLLHQSRKRLVLMVTRWRAGLIIARRPKRSVPIQIPFDVEAGSSRSDDTSANPLSIRSPLSKVIRLCRPDAFSGRRRLTPRMLRLAENAQGSALNQVDRCPAVFSSGCGSGSANGAIIITTL